MTPTEQIKQALRIKQQGLGEPISAVELGRVLHLPIEAVYASLVVLNDKFEARMVRDRRTGNIFWEEGVDA